MFRRGVGYPSDRNLLAFSGRVNVVRANHGNMDELYGESAEYTEYVPTMQGDIDIVLEVFRTKFGDNAAQLRSPSVRNPDLVLCFPLSKLMLLVLLPF